MNEHKFKFHDVRLFASVNSKVSLRFKNCARILLNFLLSFQHFHSNQCFFVNKSKRESILMRVLLILCYLIYHGCGTFVRFYATAMTSIKTMTIIHNQFVRMMTMIIYTMFHKITKSSIQSMWVLMLHATSTLLIFGKIIRTRGDLIQLLW